jgi:hypothetical protein
MFDTSEYYGGTYPSPPEEYEEKEEEEFDMGTYIDYCYENYRDSLYEREESDNNVE